MKFVLLALCLALPLKVSAQAEATPALSMRVAVEGGVGTRRFELPEDGVVYRVDAGVFPVLGAGLAFAYAAATSVSLEVLTRYQSSVGLDIIELHTNGSRVAIETRAHRFEAALGPSFRFDDAGRWALALHAGYGVLGFRPLVHLVTPAYSLSGPLLRAQLHVPLVSDVLRVRLAPEGQWIVLVGDDLEERGIASSGFALGAEAALELSIGRHITLHASYREAWSLLGSAQAQTFKDVARFVTAGAGWTL